MSNRTIKHGPPSPPECASCSETGQPGGGNPPGMKVLVIAKGKTGIPQTTLWEALGRLCRLELVEFGAWEMGHYAEALRRLDFSRCDRVVLDQNIRRIGRQYPALRAVPNLVFLEQDACQHFIPESRWHGRYEAVFRDVGRLRVVVSNRTCEAVFRRGGLDCVCLAKAVDEKAIQNLHQPRDIVFGYVGRVNHAVYTRRRALLEQVRAPLGLEMLRTESWDTAAYNRLLNRIRFFVSADVGMNEYMFKNFEAMAAGCVLLAQRQPALEQEGLGFVDMEHLALYENGRELVEKAERLRRDPALADRIAARGQALVLERHTMSRRAAELYDLIQPPIRAGRALSFAERVRHLWSRPFWR